MKKFVFTFVMAFLFVGVMAACNKKQKNATEKSLAATSDKNRPFDFLEVGSSGGITGGGHTYRIAPNGDLQKLSRKTAAASSDTSFLRTIPPKELEKVVAAIADNKFNETNFNDPGNMSFFIRLVQGGKTHEVIWGRRANETPENIKQLYNVLMEVLIKE